MAPRWAVVKPLAPISSPALPVSQIYYLLRSRADGRYLAARIRDDSAATAGFLLVFKADYDALSYLGTHAPDLGDQFSVESVTTASLKPLLSRWDFQGLGMVSDPRPPDIEFFNRTP